MKLRKYDPINKEFTDEYVYYYGQKEIVELADSSKLPKVRGVWVSNVANIDTPIMKSIASYKQYLVDMIANIASYNMNLIIFQVRPTNDAYYVSKFNPWSRFITGEENKDPGFDVLQFVIDEAKKYNIEVHAWMNPYRVGTQKLSDLGMTKEEYLNTLSPKNFARINPEDTIVDGHDKVILKPSSPKVIEFVTASLMEVIEKYDVTGIHIDDYFYPYGKIDEALELDDYKKDLENNPGLLFDDWRRNNVNILVEKISIEKKKLLSNSNRKVDFGISPFGIYRTNKEIDEAGWEEGSYHVKGVCQCYSDLFSDIYKWMKEGWIDYVCPQMYFPFERKDVNYHDLTKWWAKAAEKTHTKLYIGQAMYQMGSNEIWSNPDEIDCQLSFNNQFDNILGTIFFTYRDFVKGQNDIKDQALSKLKKRWNVK